MLLESEPFGKRDFASGRFGEIYERLRGGSVVAGGCDEAVGILAARWNDKSK